MFSSLSESGFIPTRSIRRDQAGVLELFSSLSESGFIPTTEFVSNRSPRGRFGSHLFQRVASFLHVRAALSTEETNFLFSSLSESGFIPTSYSWRFRSTWASVVLISFREWLHSYNLGNIFQTIRPHGQFSSLSESGFIPTL